jgi:antitoxin component HigA of HigAB toxin-antitoxin module
MIQKKHKVKSARNKSVKPDSETRRPVKKIKAARKRIQSKEVYELTMKEIDALMKKGEENLSQKELDRLRILAEAAENYEDTHEPLPVPSTLQDMIRMKMFQLRLKQQYTAKLLGVSEAKLSLIMSGKQKPDIYFVKALHEKLKLDANQILQAV